MDGEELDGEEALDIQEHTQVLDGEEVLDGQEHMEVLDGEVLDGEEA